MVSDNETQFVRDNWSAGDTAKLVFLQPVLFGRERALRIEYFVTHEFKEASVKGVGPGLRQHVHCAGRVEPVLVGDSAGFVLELLFLIGEWHRYSLIAV